MIAFWNRTLPTERRTDGTVPRSRLDALQGLRGCAALMVVIGHSLAIYRGASGIGNAPVDVYGALGVNTFFVISGFLMVYVHGNDFGQPAATRTFYARRIARIVPLYWAITILYGAKQVYFGNATISEILKSLFFIPFQNADGVWRPVLGLGWTLNYEMLFYLVFGLALFARRGLWLVVALFGSLTILHLAGAFSPENVLAFWSHPMILYFLAGVGIALLRRRIPGGPSFGVALGVAVVTLALTASAVDVGLPATIVSVMLPVAALVCVTVTALADSGAKDSLLRRLARSVGDASYSIYLTHSFVIAPAAKLGVAKLFPELPIVPFTLMMVPLSAFAGYLVFRYVEKPLIKAWTRTFVRQPASRTTTPART